MAKTVLNIVLIFVGVALLASGLTGLARLALAEKQQPLTVYVDTIHIYPRSEPEQELADDSDALQLARVCLLEADLSYSDCTAIGYVIRKRSQRLGVSFVDMLNRYSAINRDNARARRIRSYGTEVPELGARWAALRSHARAVLRGQALDPCAGKAEHWGGVMDAPWPGLRRVRCTPATVNIFYRVSTNVRPNSSKRSAYRASSGYNL